jgi:hypothetical protein
MSAKQLAEATRRIDPEHQGVSRAYIGHLSRSGSSARQTCGRETAELIAQALGVDVRELFIEEPSDTRTPTAATTTVEGRNSMNTSPPEELLSQPEFQRKINRSRWYVDQMVKRGMPVQYHRGTGRRVYRRFNLAQCLEWLRAEAPQTSDRHSPAA